MLKRKIIKYLISLIIFLLSSVFFFPAFYINLFSNFSKKVISNYLNSEYFDYESIHGSFLKGLTLKNLEIKDSSYYFQAKESYFSLNFLKLFKFAHVSIEDADLEIFESVKKYSLEKSSLTDQIDSLSIRNCNVKYRDFKIVIDSMDLNLSKNSGIKRIGGSLKGRVFNNNIIIKNIDLTQKDDISINAIIEFENINYHLHAKTDKSITKGEASIDSEIFNLKIGSLNLFNNISHIYFDIQKLTYKNIAILDYKGELNFSDKIKLSISNEKNEFDFIYNYKNKTIYSYGDIEDFDFYTYKIKVKPENLIYNIDYNLISKNINYSIDSNIDIDKDFKIIDINIKGKGPTLDSIQNKIYINQIKILDDRYNNITGSLDFHNGEIAMEINGKDALGLSFNLKNNFLNLQSLKLPYKDDFFLIHNARFKLESNQVYSDKIIINYKKGEMRVLNSFFEDLQTFKIYATFKNFDIDFSPFVRFYGVLDGEIQALNNKKETTTVLANLNINNLNYKDINLNNLEIITSYNNKRLSISSLKMNTEIGHLEIGGDLNLEIFNNKKISLSNLNLKASNKSFDLSIADKFLLGLGLKGTLSGDFSINGSIDNPTIIAKASIYNFENNIFSSDSLKIKTILKDSNLMINYIDAYLDGGSYSVRGSLPLADLFNIFSNNTAKDHSKRLDLNIKCNNIKNFTLLTDHITFIDSINFKTPPYIDINIINNGEGIKKYGELIFSNAKIYSFYNDDPMNNVSGKIKFNDNRISTNKLIGDLKFNSKPGLKNTNIEINGSIEFDNFFERPYFNLEGVGENVYLNSEYAGFYGNANLFFSIKGSAPIKIEGSIAPNPYDFTIYNIFSSRDFNLFDNNISKNSNILYDIKLPFTEGINIMTNDYNLKVYGDLRMTSSNGESFDYVGIMNIDDGNFIFNGNNFENTKGKLVFTPNDNNPLIDIETTTKFYNENIEINFFGTLNKPTLSIDYNGNNDFSEKSLLQYLAFKNTSNKIIDSNQLGDAIANIMQDQLSREIKKITSLDEFSLKTNYSENSESSNTEVYLGKKIQKDIYMNTKYDIEKSELTEFEIQHDINSSSQIVLNHDKRESSRWTVKYRIKVTY